MVTADSFGIPVTEARDQCRLRFVSFGASQEKTVNERRVLLLLN